jgi:hypothetical protein
MEWFMERNGERVGPFSDTKIREMAGQGLLKSDTRVWKAGFLEWTRAADVPGLLTPPELPPSTGSAARSPQEPSVSASASHVPAAAEYRIPMLAAAWPRYWARMLDLLIGAAAGGLVLAVVAPQFFSAKVFTEPAGEIWLNMIFVPIALVLDAVCGAAFGNTPGKAIAGLRVRTLRNERPALGDLITRNLRLYFSGLAMGFPLITLFTLVKSYNTVKDNEIVSWDLQSNTRCYDTGGAVWRTWVTALLVFVFYAMIAALGQ